MTQIIQDNMDGYPLHIVKKITSKHIKKKRKIDVILKTQQNDGHKIKNVDTYVYIPLTIMN